MWHRSLKDHIYFWVRNIKMIFMLKITKILFTLLPFCILEMKHDFEEHLDFYELGWRFAVVHSTVPPTPGPGWGLSFLYMQAGFQGTI